MAARWHQDSDRWIWRLYEGPDGDTGKVTSTGEDTTDVYIVPDGARDEWWIVNAKELMNDKTKDWIVRVQQGEGVRVSGPFANEKDAKAAWRVMYG